MNKYLKFEYWNTCDLGNIYYQGGQHFIFYLDADVGEPIHEEVEEGQENGDGDFIPTYRRQMKRYRIRTGLIPDYLIDAIQRMKLHDTIELTFKSGEIEQIYNVDVEPEWQFEKYAWQGTVTLTFDMDESITVGACCDNLTVEAEPPGPVDLGGYYLAPTGSDDTGDGSFLNPWFTLAPAWAAVSAGDTIYVRGGTYAYTTTNSLSNKNGAAGNLISILNYPGEKPVFDYSGGVPYTSQRIGFSMTNVSYIHIKGIRVTSITQPEAGTIAMYGMLLWNNVTHATFELMEFDHIGGWGVTIGDNCTDLLFLNCDSHHHADPYTSGGNPPYGWSDGFQTGSTTSTGITFVGCRAWSNADDGWDFRGANGIYTLINCWSFRNGFIPDTWDTAGNGVGFKMGGKSTASTTDILRHVYNCVAFENRMIGFNLGAADANKCLGAEFYHCTAYNNYQGFNVNSYTNNADIKNSISYDNSGGNYYGNAYTTVSACSWSGFTVTDGDFVSLDTTGVSGARQSDGSLPLLTFLHLAADSDLRAAGVAIAGLTTDGDGDNWHIPPSLGAYEY